MVLEHCIQQHDFVTDSTQATGTFTQYVWNIAQMMLFNYTCSEEMTAPSNFFLFPGIKLATTPTTQSVKEYPGVDSASLGYSHVWPIQELHVFQWADKKTGPTNFTKFSGFVGDTMPDIMTKF